MDGRTTDMDKNIKFVKCLECNKEVNMKIPYLWSLNSKQIKMICPHCGHVYTIESRRKDNYEFQSIASMNKDVLSWLFIWIFLGAVIMVSTPEFYSFDGILTCARITLGISTIWFILIPTTRYWYKRKVMKIYLQYVSRMQVTKKEEGQGDGFSCPSSR